MAHSVVVILIIWIGLAIVIGEFASGQGRSGFGWFILAFLLLLDVRYPRVGAWDH